MQRGERLLSVPLGKLLGRKKANKLLQFYSQFMNAEMRAGPKNDLLIGDHGIIFQIAGNGTGGGAAVLDANYKLMIVTSLGSNLTPPIYDMLICREWDKGTATFKDATIHYVAKDFPNRTDILQEYFLDNGDNVTQTYTQLTKTAQDITYGDNFRIGTDNVRTELQTMTPRYMTKDILTTAGKPIDQALIRVVDTGFDTGVRDATGAVITKLEVGPHRNWAKYATT